jgi:hypothetical protein
MWGIDEEEVKKRVYLASTSSEEVNCSSGPLTELAVKHLLSVAPRKKGQLKTGYASRLTCEAAISPCALMLGLFYVKRVTESNAAFVKAMPSRELFLAAMIAANKYLTDPGEEEALVNSDWAEIGHFSREKIDHLEVQFLNAIDWRLFVSVQQFTEFVTGVEGRVALAQAQIRGWLSYSDLVSIWEWVDVDSTMISAASQAACTIATSTAVYLMCITALFATSCSFATQNTTTHGENTLTTLAGDFSPVDYTVFHSSHLQPPVETPFSPLQLASRSEHLEWNWDWGPGTEIEPVHHHTCPWLSHTHQKQAVERQQLTTKQHKRVTQGFISENITCVSNWTRTDHDKPDPTDEVEVHRYVKMDDFSRSHLHGLVRDIHSLSIVVN